MIRSTQDYLQSGGRMMYLGGNGMYWVTQLDPRTGASVEIRRRGPSTRMWEPEPGEAHLSATGELRGLWLTEVFHPSHGPEWGSLQRRQDPAGPTCAKLTLSTTPPDSFFVTSMTT